MKAFVPISVFEIGYPSLMDMEIESSSKTSTHTVILSQLLRNY